MAKRYKMRDGERIEITGAELAELEAQEAAFAADTSKREARARIAKHEGEITPRRLREAVLTAAGKAWLQAKEVQIETERSKL